MLQTSRLNPPATKLLTAVVVAARAGTSPHGSGALPAQSRLQGCLHPRGAEDPQPKRQSPDRIRDWVEEAQTLSARSLALLRPTIRADGSEIWFTWNPRRKSDAVVLDYIEGQGQVLGYYTNELHHRGYQKATCFLPHDGANTNAVTGLRYADHLKDAEFRVEVKRNMGAGAVAMRIEAVRRIFNRCRFDEKKCTAGID